MNTIQDAGSTPALSNLDDILYSAKTYVIGTYIFQDGITYKCANKKHGIYKFCIKDNIFTWYKVHKQIGSFPLNDDMIASLIETFKEYDIL